MNLKISKDCLCYDIKLILSINIKSLHKMKLFTQNFLGEILVCISERII